MDKITLRILVDIGHPAHVHFFKHILWKIEEMGGKYCIATRQKDIATDLLESYGFEYEVIGKYSSLREVAVSLITTNYRLLKIARKFNPHVFMGIAALHSTHVSFLMNRISMAFDDTDSKNFEFALSLPFVTKFYTPKVFKKHLTAKQIRYNGFHELTYLTPKYFQPDPEVLRKYGLSPNEIFFIVRKVGDFASHDIGQKGITHLKSIVNYLQKYGKVFLTTEIQLEDDLGEVQTLSSPADLHTILSYSRLLIGDSPTMASESVALGVPTIYVSTQVCGTTQEQINAGLVHYIDPSTESLGKIIETIDLIIKQPIETHRKRARTFNAPKIDLIDFICNETLKLARNKYQK